MDVARPIHNKQTYKYDFVEMWILLQSYKWKGCPHLRKFVPQTLVYTCIYNLFHVPHTCLHFYKDYSSKIVYLKEVIAPKKSTMIESYINGH